MSLHDDDLSAVITVTGHVTTAAGTHLLCGVRHVAIVGGRAVLDGEWATADPAYVAWIRARLWELAGLGDGRVADVDLDGLFQHAPLARPEGGELPD